MSGLHTQTVTASDASASAGGCANNPCDPYCIGIDVDAGTLTPDGVITTTTIQGTLQDITSFPAAKRNASATPCTIGAPPANLNLCSYDYCCSSTSSTCVQWIDPVKSAACVVNTGVDYTLGIGCQDAAGNTHIPVCNRGSADSPTTGKLAVMGYPANPNATGASSSPSVCQNSGTTPAEGCLIDLAIKPIKAGTCIDVDVTKGAAGTQSGVKCQSSADFGNGNRTSQVNPPATTSLPSNLIAANGGSATYTQLAEADKCNGFSFVYTQVGSCGAYGIQPPPPSGNTFKYVANCPAGTRVQWNQFAYKTNVPNASDVLFQVHTAPLASDGGAGTYSSLVTIAHPATPLIVDPATCSMSGPLPCPKSLYTTLGLPAATNPVLELALTLTSTTAIPSIDSWQVTFDCRPLE
jgi:hypothetical protein